MGYKEELALAVGITWSRIGMACLEGGRLDLGMASSDQGQSHRRLDTCGHQPAHAARDDRQVVAPFKISGRAGQPVVLLRLSHCRQRRQLPYPRPAFRRRTSVSVSPAPSFRDISLNRYDLGGN